MNMTDFLLSQKFRSGRGYQINYAWDSNGRLEYIGFAQAGVADDAAGWQIIKKTWNANGTPAKDQASHDKAVWDDRAKTF